MLRKFGQGFDWLKDFPMKRDNVVYFRLRKILQAIKDQARARHTGAIFALMIAAVGRSVCCFI